jgi:DNA repair exonuclease SbcCD ATPase subunit
MQDQDKEFTPSDAEESAGQGLTAEPVDIFSEQQDKALTGELAEDAEETETAQEEETRARRIFRKFIRWTVGLLVVFGLGFLAAVFSIYTPKVNELERSENDVSNAGITIQDLENQAAALQDQIDGLNGQINTLNQKIDGLENANQTLRDDQNDFNLHIALLKARVEVVSAQVEIFDENPAQARVLLENTDQTLTEIESLLPDDLKDVVAPLKTRLDLAISEIDTDPETAIDDLSILAGDLLEIENALFGE